jgi:hypothetical protein
MALAGVAAVFGGGVAAAGAEPAMGFGGLGGGAAHAIRRARTRSAAGLTPGAGVDRSRRRRFVTKLRANVAKPQKATLKFGISAAL